MSLNDTKIRSLKPSAKPFKVSDSHGLYLLVNPGGSRLWYLKYRINGKESRLGLGAYPDVSLAYVRQKRDGIRKLLTQNINPSQQRIAENAARSPEKIFKHVALSGWTLEHHLDNHAAKLILEKKGASGWINGDRATFLNLYQVKHRPDGLLTLPDGNVIAIETERRLKTRVRYQSIMASHLLARTRKQRIYVFYVVPDPQKKRALELLFDSIRHVIINHQHVPLEERHRRVFRIYTFDELKHLVLGSYT